MKTLQAVLPDIECVVLSTSQPDVGFHPRKISAGKLGESMDGERESPVGKETNRMVDVTWHILERSFMNGMTRSFLLRHQA